MLEPVFLISVAKLGRLPIEVEKREGDARAISWTDLENFPRYASCKQRPMIITYRAIIATTPNTITYSICVYLYLSTAKAVTSRSFPAS